MDRSATAKVSPTSDKNPEAADAGPPGLPALSLPKGGRAIGGIGEKFGANPVTGTGSFSVPILTSPGRSGFGPQLALAYDSGAGNGPFGLGWHLSAPAITRKTDKGLPLYEDDRESDVFLLSDAEDLVPVLRQRDDEWERDACEVTRSGATFRVQRYRPRVESAFARIERWRHHSTGETHWRTISRDNLTSLYGDSAASRIADPESPDRVFGWLLSRSWDDRGNLVVYEHKADDREAVREALHERHRSEGAQRYLKRILYGNARPYDPHDPVLPRDWHFQVIFDYGEHDAAAPRVEEDRPWPSRPDAFSTYRACFEVRTRRLCRRVLMFHQFAELGDEPCLVRSTDFTYDETPVNSRLVALTQTAYLRNPEDGSYRVCDPRTGEALSPRSLPSLEIDYSVATIDDTPRRVEAESVANLPAGADGSRYQWVDLDGEGLPGVLTEQGSCWFYKRNVSALPRAGGGVTARFEPLEWVASRPSLANLGGGRQHFMDLAGDGHLSLVQYSRPMSGFHERLPEEGWLPFQPFAHAPTLDWDSANLKFVDLDGDGHADVLISEDDVFTWYPSHVREGFGQAQRVPRPTDEERGPALVFADRTDSVYLADFSGDGLTDIVRIRNGEVCYWPNLGYGHFGAKVTMDNPPVFDYADSFDPRRIRLADVDGSGTTDLIYLGAGGIRLFFNQLGNTWSAPRSLPQFPVTGPLDAVTVVDLLGNGTACIVWSSPLPGEARAPLRYLDLMGGTKPYLLIATRNNLGAETRVRYVPSTRFYLEDRAAGRPWITRLPFPVHVVERVETFDHISRNLFVTRYAYHHGYFDGVEREFRGFGMVEQWDTEELATLGSGDLEPGAANWDAASHVPPMLTRTWFHTGVFFERGRVARQFEHEYYRETAGDRQALLLGDSVLPAGLSTSEAREACRALKGSMLRQEIYALDGTAKQAHPYTVSEQSFAVRHLQPRAGNRHAAFFTHARDSISHHYERQPADPRISHALTLEVDDFGNVRRSAVVGYGRRQPDPALEARDQAKQGELLITYTENDVTNPVAGADIYRTPLPSEARTYELTGLALPAGHRRFTVEDVLRAGTTAAPIDYEQSPAADTLQKRLIEQLRTLYRHDDLSGPSPLGEMDSLALPFESYKLAFTPGLVAEVYGGRVTDAMLAAEGGYVHSGSDAQWWIPSGRVFYSPDPADAPAQELAYARAHFFLPQRFRDPFHTDLVSTERFARYDAYDLLVEETRDALGNRTTVGERDVDPTLPLVRHGQDYRVLHPALVMDPNRNRSSVAFDVLGMVVGTAVQGKPEDNPARGDRFDGFAPDLADSVVAAHLEDPLADPQAILQHATTRLVYDLFAYVRTKDQVSPQPAVVYALARETHDADLAPGEKTRIQHSFSYSDGFGREIQKKIQAEPGPAPKRDAAGAILVGPDGLPEETPFVVSPRWVGSGWTVFNNKGKPVRKFEPFFTDTQRFELDIRLGVSPVLFYDPVERVVGTLHPNHTWEKVAFDPWRQETWDVNDTVLVADPEADPDIGDFFRRLPAADYLPTWYSQRQDRAHGRQEQEAARKAAVHAATPTVAYLDSLGRTFLSVAHNRFKRSDTPPADLPTEELYRTRTVFDTEGNQRAVVDAKNRVVMRYDYDVLSHRIHQASMDAGERWILNDAAGKPLYAWDSRGHQFRTAYDPLRRPTGSFLREGAEPEVLVGQTVYGESRSHSEAKNLRGKVFQIFDQAGLVTNEGYDFKDSLLGSERQLAQAYKATLDWSATVPLEADTYTSRTRYDALNRPTELTSPDHSVIRHSYNEANLLVRVEANLRGAAVATPFVTNIDYDAKGRRTRIDYGNGVRTSYAYDPLTFRLVHLLTRRDAGAFPNDCPLPSPPGWPGCQLQNLHYTHDPAGNITHIHDDAQQTIYFRNKRVHPSAKYTYDALYQLIEATGREHLGQAAGKGLRSAKQPDHTDTPRVNVPQPGDGSAMGTYTERFNYDAAGNVLAVIHRAQSGGWTRWYAYTDASSLESAKPSNRLTSTSLPGDDLFGPYSAKYRYDQHGNISDMPCLALMQWNYHDQLQATARQAVGGGPDTTWYVYDANGQRVRKVTDHQATTGQTHTRMKERIYLDNFELYREYRADGNRVRFERETLHIMDDKQRTALVETRTAGADSAAAQLSRYQLSNHLGSASLELDDQARIISYEEYYPYGSTSYQAVRSQTETAKRYRYAGKERDKESGFSYFGTRYYAPWLLRWLAADPMLQERLQWTPYVYVRNNPLVNIDTTGSLDHSVHEQGITDDEGANDALNRPGHEGPHIEYGSFRDRINTRFARWFNSEFRSRFNEWRESPDRYRIQKDPDASARLVEAKPIQEERVFPGLLDEHSHYDVKYRAGLLTIPKLPPPIRVIIKLALLVIELPKLALGSISGLVIGFHNLLFKQKWGWGMANRIETEGGLNLLSYGFGDYNRYNMLGIRIHPKQKQEIHPEDHALLGIIGRHRPRRHGHSRPSQFFTVGGETKSGWQAIIRLGSHRHHRHHLGSHNKPPSRRYHLF
ncbi:MAG TPA: SpvB/TcaC N-terminal domain-containing protein [Thermoanaerobaculia bacterium]|jgi:RHS repeat-associated protein|nr:SpvB/TcaC N-terminal domain-containing protein [Thermoanaerobaculia bacterium]